MHKLPKIKRSFTYLTDSKFNTLSQGVIRSLTGNTYFPEIGDELALFKEAYDQYFNSIPSRNIRNAVNSAVKNTNKEQAINALFRLSFLVAYYADFDIDALESSGFELVNKRQRKALVGLVKNIELRVNGIEGMIIATCQRDENATTYKARVSTDGENWLWLNSNSSRTVKVHDVPRGETLYVQMQLENAKGFSPWSDAVSGMIPSGNIIPSIHE